MRKIVGLLLVVCISSSLFAIDYDPAKKFVITGQYLPGNGTTQEQAKNDDPTDWTKASIIVIREVTRNDGKIEVVQLASGRFEDGRVTLEGEIDEPSEVRVLIQTGDSTLSVDTLIVPSGEAVSFALVKLKNSQQMQLLLVGTSRQATNSDESFSVSGSFQLEDHDVEEARLKAHLFTEINNNGRPSRVMLGVVLLDRGKFKIQADIDEPRVAKLEVFNGRPLIWDTLMVIEPEVEISIERYGPDSVFHEATSKEGRHKKLLDSWRLSEDYLGLWHKYHTAGKQLREKVGTGKPIPLDSDYMSLWHELQNMRLKELKRLAWESDDPLDSLLAVELAAHYFLIPSSLDAIEVIALYDKLSELLAEDIVARRVTPPRKRLATKLERLANDERLVVGEVVPEFTLDNLDGKQHSLKTITKENEFVLIDFWASWCGPCIATFPELKKLHASYNDQGFEIVSVSVDMLFQDWKDSSDEHVIPWINLGEIGDEFGSTAIDYGVSLLPTNYLIDTNKQIIQKNIEPSQLKTVLFDRLGEVKTKD